MNSRRTGREKRNGLVHLGRWLHAIGEGSVALILECADVDGAGERAKEARPALIRKEILK